MGYELKCPWCGSRDSVFRTGKKVEIDPCCGAVFLEVDPDIDLEETVAVTCKVCCRVNILDKFITTNH